MTEYLKISVTQCVLPISVRNVCKFLTFLSQSICYIFVPQFLSQTSVTNVLCHITIVLCLNFVTEYLLHIFVTQFLSQMYNFCVIDTNGHFCIDVAEGASPRKIAIALSLAPRTS